MPSGKRESAYFQYLGALAAGQPAEIRERRQAAEQTLALVRGRLGAPGTYDMPTPWQEPGAPPGTQPVQPQVQPGQQVIGRPRTKIEKAFKTAPIEESAARWLKYGGTKYVMPGALQTVKKLKPGRYARELEKTAEFRMVSRMTAEAEQMLAREGPLWDDLIKNTQLPIIEGYSAMARDNAENIRRAMQKGGAARRTAFETVQRMNSQREINTRKVQAIAQARVDLDTFARENARKQISFNQAWTENLAGVRESYNAAMDNAAALMASTALPVMFASVAESAKWRYYGYNKNREKLGKWISGAMSLASLGIGGLGAAATAGMMGPAVGRTGALAGIAEAAAPYVGPLTGMGARGLVTAGFGGTPSPTGY